MSPAIDAAARFYSEGNWTEAARVCLGILESDPAQCDALHLLGVVCAHLGQSADAVGYLTRAAALQPENPKILANLGNAFGGARRFDQAAAAYQRALALHLREAGTLNNLGLALLALDRRDEAIVCFQDALTLDPAHHASLYNLARAKAEAGLFQEAEADFRRLQAALPAETSADRLADAAHEFARLYMRQARADEALAVLRDQAARRPDIGMPLWNEALVLLVLGRFAEGWPAYESRWLAPGHDAPHPDHAVLDLDRVAGKRVLVKQEQGRGDVIQFLRYLRPLAALGARVRVSVYDDLVPLALEIPEVEEVTGADAPEPEYDLLTSIMSLPLAFRTDLATIPATVPYLRTPASRVARMRHHLGPAHGPRMGVVWSGSAESRHRSALPAAALEPLLRRPGITFHCLQRDILPEDRAWLDRTGLVVTHECILRDFADTAALIESMDLVISIDTAVAHLAGALARPVWIMIAFDPDWRWLLGREDTPWYPTARLFRQTAPGDWGSAVAAVDTALAFDGR